MPVPSAPPSLPPTPSTSSRLLPCVPQPPPPLTHHAPVCQVHYDCTRAEPRPHTNLPLCMPLHPPPHTDTHILARAQVVAVPWSAWTATDNWSMHAFIALSLSHLLICLPLQPLPLSTRPSRGNAMERIDSDWSASGGGAGGGGGRRGMEGGRGMGRDGLASQGSFRGGRGGPDAHLMAGERLCTFGESLPHYLLGRRRNRLRGGVLVLGRGVGRVWYMQAVMLDKADC